MKHRKKRPPAFRAMALRIGALVLALWLFAMGLLTWAVAVDMQRQFKEQLQRHVNYMPAYYAPDHSKEFPTPIDLIRHLGAPYIAIFLDLESPFLDRDWENVISNNWFQGQWNLHYGFEIAEVYYEADRSNALMQTGDYLSFCYVSAENWERESADSGQYGYISLPNEMTSRLWDRPDGMLTTTFLETLRMTGWFEGNRFHPTLIESGTVSPDLNITDPDLERLMRLDSRELLLWETLYAQDAPEGQALQTIYCWDLDGYVSSLQPVTINGVTYDDLLDLYCSGNYEDSDSLICGFYNRSSYIQEGESTYRYTVVARYWPLQYAALRLIPTYLISFAAVALCLLLLLWWLHKRLTKPLAQLVEFGVSDADKAWAEPHALDRQICEDRKALAEANTELQQLRTALEYAQNAEESRKILISSIAHELKTPLAVIHSYAEGLQAGIAPEKQEQYLSIILSESEKMDAMVLQMLDLSRLEAGRVRLSMDSVSLLALTKAVEQRFAPMLEEKGLTVHYDLAPSFLVIADEARMEQVISNLMSNAIKYSPPGGQIRVKIFPHEKQARFLMENTAPHLSEEALEKVWDSFYRADPSRSEPGTGLGLALVKRIVALHRGSCTVRNTHAEPGDVLPTAVEFGFSLPLS